MLSAQQQQYLMRQALQEAERGMQEGEAPIGCVIARENDQKLEILARGHNRMNALQNKIAHAEIVTFFQAAREEGVPPTLPLDCKDAILVSTLEPCVMCFGAAMEAGIATVLFGLQAPADGGTQRVKPPESPESSFPRIQGGILADESRRLFERWLEGKEESEQTQFVRQLLERTEKSTGTAAKGRE